MARIVYKDIDLKFDNLDGDVSHITNESAIKNSVKNIVLTFFEEKKFNPFFGTGINRMLFETISDLDMFYVSRQIRTALSNYEPRIDNIKVDTTFYPSKNTIYCEIRYDIIKLNITITQNVNIERVR